MQNPVSPEGNAQSSLLGYERRAIECRGRHDPLCASLIHYRDVIAGDAVGETVAQGESGPARGDARLEHQRPTARQPTS